MPEALRAPLVLYPLQFGDCTPYSLRTVPPTVGGIFKGNLIIFGAGLYPLQFPDCTPYSLPTVARQVDDQQLWRPNLGGGSVFFLHKYT